MCTLVGGAVTGLGLMMLAQVHFMLFIQDEVDHLSGASRFLGRLTFLWRELPDKFYLAVAEIEPDLLLQSETVAKWIIAVGLLGLGLLLPEFLRRRWGRR